MPQTSQYMLHKNLNINHLHPRKWAPLVHLFGSSFNVDSETELSYSIPEESTQDRSKRLIRYFDLCMLQDIVSSKHIYKLTATIRKPR